MALAFAAAPLSGVPQHAGTKHLLDASVPQKTLETYGKPSTAGVKSMAGMVATGVSLHALARRADKKASKKRRKAAMVACKAAGFWRDRWGSLQKLFRPATAGTADSAGDAVPCLTRETLKLRSLGCSPQEKALQVNLDPNIYGSFAEIGAGQEVSRTFLQAGAAAGTVAKSLSAYDMQMSDALYGTAKRYVTQERLIQMMDGEYKDLEAFVREGKAAWGGKGPEVRFFSFAATLAAKAYMSDRECEGWVGVKYQHEAGAEPSSVEMHIRMSDPTAQLQGEAVGVLGTNLIYLISKTNCPYLITTFLLDGMEEGRLEVDFINFSGPAFPDDSYDPRLLALRMVQFRMTPCVLLEKDAKTGTLSQAVPNNALYKTPLIVQRSRFLPVTNTHKELMESAERQVLATSGESDRKPKGIFAMQIDDFLRPKDLCDSVGRYERAVMFLEADKNQDGLLSIDELKAMLTSTDSEEELNELVAALDHENTGAIPVDELTSLCNTTLTAEAFLDRCDMLQPLEYSVVVTRFNRDTDVANYLHRYTNQQITLVVGGGSYDISRGIFNSQAYSSATFSGGLLGAFGQLFEDDKLKIFQYPNVNDDGTVAPPEPPEGSMRLLYQYFQEEGDIVSIDEAHMSPRALDSSTNKFMCAGSREVVSMIGEGNSDWEVYVPPQVVDIVKKRKWFLRVAQGATDPAGMLYKFVSKVSK